MITFFEELCSRLDIDYSDLNNNDLFSETELTSWLTLGKDLAVARHTWPFTEGRREIASVSGTEQYDYPTDMKSDSLRYLTVDGKHYEKKLFEDYLRYKEDYPSGSKKFYSDRNRILYVNTLAEGFANSIVCYGQVEVSGTVDSTVSSSVFTMAEPEGDEAIIKLAYATALGNDKLKRFNDARKERIEAFEILDAIWAKIAAKQHTYQTQDNPMFKYLNVVDGAMDDEIRSRNQFNI